MNKIKQPEIEILEELDSGKLKSWGKKKIIQINWDHTEEIYSIAVDFMENSNSRDYLYMFKSLHGEDGSFISVNGNLKGYL